MKNPNINNFFICPTSKEEVFDILKELDPTKAGDIYRISPKYAIDSRFLLSEFLCTLFNKSVEEHTFPDDLKLPEIAPIHKGKSKLDYTNYRPISILVQKITFLCV